MHSCSASSGKPDSNSLDCIVFFLLCDVSWLKDVERWEDLLFWCLMYLYHEVILLVQMSLWQLMYLQGLDIRYCRCSFLDRCICKTLIFSVADALFLTNVSATCFSLSLKILLSSPIMYNCIYILLFLGFEDTSFANFTSISHILDNVKMLPSKITHPSIIMM